MKVIHNKVLLTCLSGLTTVLVGCGGGSSDVSDNQANGAEEAINQSPVAMAGVDISAFEQRTVTLDASQSSDAEGSMLQYYWHQLSGPSVILSNESSDTPTLQLPVVASDTEVMMALEVTDDQGQSSVDQLKIRVLEQSDEQGLSLLPQRPVILANGNSVDVAFDLDAPEGLEKGAGLVVNLHWDSTQLTFNALGHMLQEKQLGVSDPIKDVTDIDNNPRTDQYVTLSWVDFEGAQWLSGATFPLSLFSAAFDPVAGAIGSTQVSVSPQYLGVAQVLLTQTVSVEL